MNQYWKDDITEIDEEFGKLLRSIYTDMTAIISYAEREWLKELSLKDDFLRGVAVKNIVMLCEWMYLSGDHEFKRSVQDVLSKGQELNIRKDRILPCLQLKRHHDNGGILLMASDSSLTPKGKTSSETIGAAFCEGAGSSGAQHIARPLLACTRHAELKTKAIHQKW